jgi:hypothetical protein
LALQDAPWFLARKALAQNMLDVLQKKHSALQVSQQWHKQLKPEDVLNAYYN